MALQTNLLRRNGTYYCRFYVPTELQLEIGKKEIWRSLKTNNYAEAIHTARLKVSEIILDMALMAKKRQLSERIINQVAQQHYKVMLDKYDDDSDRMPKDIISEAHDLEGHYSRGIEQSYHDATEDLRRRDYTAGEHIAVNKLFAMDITPEDLQSHTQQKLLRKLAQKLLQAQQKALGETLRRINGDFSNLHGEGESLAVVPLVEFLEDEPPIEDTVTLQQAINEYNEAPQNKQKSKGNLKKKAESQRKMLWLLDGDSKIFKYGIETAEEFFGNLLETPTNVTKKFPNMSLKQAIQETKGDDSIGRLGPKTIDRVMQDFAELLKFASRKHNIPFRNITEGLRAIDPVKAKNKRNPLTEEQLKQLFSKLHLQKFRNIRGKEYRFWLPLLALCTGIRLSEALYLKFNEIKQKDDVLYLTVKYRVDRSIKREASERIVPIHNSLIKLGFLQYVAKMEEQPNNQDYIFHDRINRTKNPADAFGKFFRRQLDNAGIKTEPHKEVFHSLRHSYRDALREGEIDTAIALALGGWEDKGVHASYGSGYSLAKLNKNLQKADFSYLNEVIND
jgi:integrase